MSKMIAITLAVLAAVTICQAIPMPEKDLADFMTKSADVMQRNPQLTSQCFDTYKPQIDALAGDYKTKLDGCSDAAAASTDKINKDVAANVESVNQWRNEICSTYNNCNQGGSDPKDFFACNNDASGPAISNSYSIQTLSKEKMDYISAQLQMVVYNQKYCTDACEADYVQTSRKLYAELQDCISGQTTAAPPKPTK